MKNVTPPKDPSRFTGTQRYYHRGGSKPPSSWDDWVEGVSAKPRGNKNWLKITGIVAALLALAGILVGLAIELA